MPSTIRALLLFLVLLPLPASAQPGKLLVDRTAYVFPSWDTAVEATDIEQYATAAEYAAAVQDDRYLFEKLRYRSDGLAVIAYFYGPPNGSRTRRPVIVFNRGSYIRGDIASELLPMFHRLAQSGFTIVAPMYRGSDGGEGRDEMGGADLNDLMNVAELLRELPSVDLRNVFLYGESRGGMMVFQAMRDDFPARAAATFGGFTDLEALASTDQGKTLAESIWPTFGQRRTQIVARRSAIQWADKLRLPLLLMHGGADRLIPVAQTLRLANGLGKTGHEYGVIVFPGGNHTLDQHRVERDRQAVEFFRRHMAN